MPLISLRPRSTRSRPELLIRCLAILSNTKRQYLSTATMLERPVPTVGEWMSVSPGPASVKSEKPEMMMCEVLSCDSFSFVSAHLCGQTLAVGVVSVKPLRKVSADTFLEDKLELAGLPCLVEPRLQRAVEAQEDVPAFAGYGLHPVGFMPRRRGRTEPDIYRGVGVRRQCPSVWLPMLGNC